MTTWETPSGSGFNINEWTFVVMMGDRGAEQRMYMRAIET